MESTLNHLMLYINEASIIQFEFYFIMTNRSIGKRLTQNIKSIKMSECEHEIQIIIRFLSLYLMQAKR